VKALSSSPSTTKKKKKKGRRIQGKRTQYTRGTMIGKHYDSPSGIMQARR
jgi:hypothetical protein